MDSIFPPISSEHKRIVLKHVYVFGPVKTKEVLRAHGVERFSHLDEEKQQKVADKLLAEIKKAGVS